MRPIKLVMSVVAGAGIVSCAAGGSSGWKLAAAVDGWSLWVKGSCMSLSANQPYTSDQNHSSQACFNNPHLLQVVGLTAEKGKLLVLGSVGRSVTRIQVTTYWGTYSVDPYRGAFLVAVRGQPVSVEAFGASGRLASTTQIPPESPAVGTPTTARRTHSEPSS